MIEAFNHAFEQLALWFSHSALWVMFFSGFLSATLLPGGSEASFIATLGLHQYSTLAVISIASIGNTLGGITNYLIGIWVPNRTDSNRRGHIAVTWLQKYGFWSLLFSWLPIIGDPLCFAAGWLRLPFWPSLLLIFIGKALRYSLLAALFFGFF